MRVLWVVNIILPQIAIELNLSGTFSGGWIDSMRQQLCKNNNIQLSIAARGPVEKVEKRTIENIDYYVFPSAKNSKYDISKENCKTILQEANPDILHIEGTEFAHACTFLQNFKGKNLVVLQGIIKGCDKYQYGNIEIDDLILSLSPQSWIIGWSMLIRKKFIFRPRIKQEVRTISLATNLMGRTRWDRAHSHWINPEAQYFNCPRILREPFYKMKWSEKDMELHSIFIGNSYSALKGAHFVLRAVALLKNEYPDIKIYIAGEPPYQEEKNFQLKKLVGYSAYLKRLIRKLKLEKNIKFLGNLDAYNMAKTMCTCNLYVLSSAIENSPNTLGEAMIMGVPCIAAFVGGIQDMAIDNEEVLFYRNDDAEMLAWTIKNVFDHKEVTLERTKKARIHAEITHNRIYNASLLLDAYSTIINK